jgi:hypothetical protein
MVFSFLDKTLKIFDKTIERELNNVIGIFRVKIVSSNPAINANYVEKDF